MIPGEAHELSPGLPSWGVWPCQLRRACQGKYCATVFLLVIESRSGSPIPRLFSLAVRKTAELMRVLSLLLLSLFRLVGVGLPLLLFRSARGLVLLLAGAAVLVVTAIGMAFRDETVGLALSAVLVVVGALLLRGRRRA